MMTAAPVARPGGPTEREGDGSLRAVDSAGAEPRPAAPRSAVPRAVWLLTAVHVVLLVIYGLVVPTFRAPDELLYVDQMRRLAGADEQAGGASAGAEGSGAGTSDGPASEAGPALAAALVAATAFSPAYTPGAPPVGLAAAVPPDDRPTFAELAAGSGPAEGDGAAPDTAPEGDGAAPDTAAGAEANAVARRPPLTSWLGAAVLTVAEVALPGWPWSFDRTVALLRLVNMALVATVPLLAWATARCLRCPPRASLAAAAAVLAVPQLTHVGSVVGDDALVVVLAALVFLLGARVVTGDRSLRTGVLAGVACGLALLASGSALVLVPWMVGAYLLAPRSGPTAGTGPTPADRRLRRGLPVIVVALAMVVGGWWHLGHLVRNQGLQLGLDQLPSVGPGAGTGLASRLLADFWGAFGGREAVLPTAAVLIATVVLGGALGVALVRGRVRPVRVRLAFLVLPALASAVFAVVAALGSTLSGEAPLRVEGRVVLVGLMGLVVVTAVGLDQLRSTPTPLLPAVVLVAAVGLQFTALAAITPRYWAGASLGERVRTVLAFSPWPPALVFTVAVSGLGLVVWALVELLGSSRRSGPTPAPAGVADA